MKPKHLATFALTLIVLSVIVATRLSPEFMASVVGVYL